MPATHPEPATVLPLAHRCAPACFRVNCRVQKERFCRCRCSQVPRRRCSLYLTALWNHSTYTILPPRLSSRRQTGRLQQEACLGVAEKLHTQQKRTSCAGPGYGRRLACGHGNRLSNSPENSLATSRDVRKGLVLRIHSDLRYI